MLTERQYRFSLCEEKWNKNRPDFGRTGWHKKYVYISRAIKHNKTGKIHPEWRVVLRKEN